MPKSLRGFRDSAIPITGLMDTRGLPDAIPPGISRLNKNIIGTNHNQVGRMPGWAKFGSESDNSDLRDQLASLVYGYPDNGDGTCGESLIARPYCSEDFETNQGREAITLLHQFGGTGGVRKLIAGTQSRLYAYTPETGNWRLIADGLGGTPECGCGPRRFQMAQLGSYAIFTNDFDPIIQWQLDGPPEGCSLQAATPVDELSDLRVYSARSAVQFKGFIFIGNLNVEGYRYGSKVIWSDFGNALSWAPSNESLAGDQDVGDPGESIVAMKALGDHLYIYKERSIWRCSLVGGNQIFQFQQVYQGEQTPRFPNAIVSTGNEHFYMGQDTIYRFDIYSQMPQEVDWIHQAAGIIYEENHSIGYDGLTGGISGDCESACGGYNPVTRDLWFSWASSPGCPDRSLLLNLRYQKSTYVDHGFTAFASFQPDERPTIKGWFEQILGCGEEFGVGVKEGASYASESDPEHPDVDRIWNDDEDLDQPASATSLCVALDGLRFEELCEDCSSESKFLMASASDFCIKEYGTVYHRDRYDSDSSSYVEDGYESSVESGALGFETDREKYLNRITVEFQPPPGDPDPVPDLSMRFGFSSQADCEVWKDVSSQPLDCHTTSTPSSGTRPHDKAYFNFMIRGRFLFYRFHVGGDTGDVRFSRVITSTRLAEA